MGLTREQWHAKRTNEIIDYVLARGEKISDTMTYWHTYPVVVKDICVSGVMVKGKKTKKLSFGDMVKKKYDERRTPEQLTRTFLEDVLADMKEVDKKYNSKK